MKTNFEISALGVEEMSKKEMKDADGGMWWWVPFVIDGIFEAITGKSIGGAIADILKDEDLIDPFWNAAQNFP